MKLVYYLYTYILICCLQFTLLAWHPFYLSIESTTLMLLFIFGTPIILNIAFIFLLKKQILILSYFFVKLICWIWLIVLIVSPYYSKLRYNYCFSEPVFLLNNCHKDSIISVREVSFSSGKISYLKSRQPSIYWNEILVRNVRKYNEEKFKKIDSVYKNFQFIESPFSVKNNHSRIENTLQGIEIKYFYNKDTISIVHVEKSVNDKFGNERKVNFIIVYKNERLIEQSKYFDDEETPNLFNFFYLYFYFSLLITLFILPYTIFKLTRSRTSSSV